VNQYETDLQPRYKINTDLSARVGTLNPLWNETATPAQIDVRTSSFIQPVHH